MTTLVDRPRTALLVIDVQNGVMESSLNSPAVIANVRSLVGRARSANVPVVWVQHSSEHLVEGSEGWRYVPELERLDEEALVPKRYGDSFEGTDLEDVLASAGAGHLVVAGAQSDFCIRSTIHGAFARGYDVTLVGDAHTTEDLTEWVPTAPGPEAVVSHMNLYWSEQSAPGRTAAVVATADVSFGTSD